MERAMESLEALQARVFAQRDKLPAMYGGVDFSITPERFAGGLDDNCMQLNEGDRKARKRLLSNPETVARARAYTMLGDATSDAYAALMPQYGFRPLVAMLTEACDKGVENVED